MKVLLDTNAYVALRRGDEAVATLVRGAAPDITISVLPDAASSFALGSGRVSSDSADPDLSNNSATAVATIEFDPNGFQKPVLAGGGIGCRQAQGGSSSRGAPLGVYAAILATALLFSRRRTSRKQLQ